MIRHTRYSTCAAVVFALGSLLAACGGGGGGSGGGGSLPPGGGGGGSTATPGQTATPASSPGATGQLVVNGLSFANVPVVFTCGCTGEGGQVTTDANGNYTITTSATAIPASTTPYSPPGHNIMVVGYAAGSATQAWTMVYLGKSPATNLNLSNTPSTASANVSDTAATAAALYTYYVAGTNSTIAASNDRTFDWFNFNTIIAFAQHLRSAPTQDERMLLDDINTDQGSNLSLYPGFKPSWSAVTTDGVNPKITSDIQKIISDGIATDNTLPTPCPGNAPNLCSGTPSP